MLEKVILIRNIFYKCFLISLAHMILVSLFLAFNKEWTANFAADLYDISKEDFYMLMVYFICFAKLFILYIFLFPALALHWTASVLKKSKSD